MKEFDFDKELEACKKKQREDETIVYTVGCGRMCPLPTDKKAIKKGMKEAMEYIKKLDGFVGVHPVDLWHTLLLFETVNNAKSARNLLKAKDISCANYVVPILVENKYLKEQRNE